MLDIKLFRDQPDEVKRALATRGEDPALVDRVAELDGKRRAAQARADEARAEQKSAGKDVAKLSGDEKQVLLARLKELSDELSRVQQEEAAYGDELRDLLFRIPNLVHVDVPAGGEEANVELRAWGEARAFDFEERDHLDLGEALGIIDMEAGAKVSGSRFTFLRGGAARLWFAVKQFAIDTLIEHGHVPVLPPVLVRRETMEGTGIFPAGEDQIYQLERDELYLVGTSEVPLAAMHRDEILDASSFPLRYVAHSACFRREAGAGGKDTRGIFRNHQFEKVEMYVFTTPERSWDEHERMIGIEEGFMRALGIPYKAMLLAAGDIYAASAKTVDLEAWWPGQQRYRETTSCSNTTDYQTRRLNIRYRTDDGPVFAHALNGTVATSSRTVAVIMENYQRADGTIEVPDALRAYTGFEVIEA